MHSSSRLSGSRAQPSVARPRHPVEQPAVVAPGEAVQRGQDDGDRPLGSLAIVSVDEGSGVERKAIEEGTAPGLLQPLGGNGAPSTADRAATPQ